MGRIGARAGFFLIFTVPLLIVSCKQIPISICPLTGNAMDAKFTPFAEYIKTRAASEDQPPSKEGFQVQRYRAGDTIFSQGARGHAAYVIKTGRVEISIIEDGVRSVLTCLDEQSVFGEVALLTGNHTRSATAVAAEDTEVVRIPREIFDQYLKASPKVISACLVAIARRLHEFSTSNLARPATLERMARIMQLFISHGTGVLDYGPTVETLARALDKETAEIEEHLSTMSDVNLVDLDSKGEEGKTIRLIGGSRFLEKALKVFSMIEGYEPV